MKFSLLFCISIFTHCLHAADNTERAFTEEQIDAIENYMDTFGRKADAIGVYHRFRESAKITFIELEDGKREMEIDFTQMTHGMTMGNSLKEMEDVKTCIAAIASMNTVSLVAAQFKKESSNTIQPSS